MSANGSAPISAEVALGVNVPEELNVFGLGLLIGGILLIVGGSIMLYTRT
jgi:hypothetical protein